MILIFFEVTIIFPFDIIIKLKNPAVQSEVIGEILNNLFFFL